MIVVGTSAVTVAVNVSPGATRVFETWMSHTSTGYGTVAPWAGASVADGSATSPTAATTEATSAARCFFMRLPHKI